MPVGWVVYCYASPPTKLLRSNYGNSFCTLPINHEGPHFDPEVNNIHVGGIWFTDKEVYYGN